MKDIECPDCASRKFYVKDPDDEFEVYEFECRSGRIEFVDGKADIDEKTEIYCDRCAWHGNYQNLKEKF